MGKYKKYTGNKKRTATNSTSAVPRASVSSKPAAGPRQAAAPKPSPKAAAAAAKEVDFRTEYRYVLGDLKRIGILAAAMFATLVILAMVLR